MRDDGEQRPRGLGYYGVVALMVAAVAYFTPVVFILAATLLVGPGSVHLALQRMGLIDLLRSVYGPIVTSILG